jgi:hypothetical protein
LRLWVLGDYRSPTSATSILSYLFPNPKTMRFRVKSSYSPLFLDLHVSTFYLIFEMKPDNEGIMSVIEIACDTLS